MVPTDWPTWPRALLALPLAALAFGAQAVPVLGFFLTMIRAEYLPGAILYAGGVGIAYEALSGRVPRAWLVVPVLGLLLSAVPRWMEERQETHERDRVAGQDQAGSGPGSQGLGILVDWPEVARVLAGRYDVSAAYARRTITSVDFVAYRRPPGAPAGTVTEAPLPGEPTGVLTVGTTSLPFERGWIEGYDLRTTATWPDGRQRARVGVSVSRLILPAFPIAGCPLGPWLKEEPCRIRLARSGARTYGYVRPHDPEAEAAAIAGLIGLVPLAGSADEPA